MHGYRSLARNRDFTALWVGQTISELGSRVSMFVFPLIAYAMTGSAVLAAAAEAVHLLGLAGALLPAGVVADRVDRRRVMRAASGSGAVLYASLVLAALLGELTLPHLLVVALLTGVVAGAFAPAEMSAVRTVVAAEDLPTALAQNQGRLHVAGLVGGPIGGALYGVARWLPFAADAASFAVSWVMLGRIRTDLSPEPTTGPRTGPRPSGRAQVAEGARYVWRHPFFRTLMIWGSLTNLTMNALFFAATLRLIQGGFAPVHIGLVETAAGASGLLGAVVAPWIIDRFATGRLTVAIAWSSVPLVVPMALWNHPLVLACALVPVLLLNPAGNAGMGAYRIAVTPPALIGRTQSFSQFVGMSSLPLAPVLAGGLLAGLGGPGAIVALGVATGLVALIPTLSRTIRAVPRPAVWRAELAEPRVPTAV